MCRIYSNRRVLGGIKKGDMWTAGIVTNCIQEATEIVGVDRGRPQIGNQDKDKVFEFL